MKKIKHKRTDSRLPGMVYRWLVSLNNRLKAAAAYLQHKTNGYSARKKKWMLFGFCFLFGLGSIMVLYQGIARKTAIHLATPIKIVPLRPFVSDRGNPIKSRELERIHRFVLYLDTLGKTPEGKRKKDSLLLSRPHLTDTLQFLENLYYEQQPTKSPTALQ